MNLEYSEGLIKENYSKKGSEIVYFFSTGIIEVLGLTIIIIFKI